MSLSIDSKILRCQKCFMVKQIIIEPNYPQTTISSECHCGILRQTIVSFMKELQKGELYVVKCSFCKKHPKHPLYCTGCRRTYCKSCNEAHNFEIKTKTPHKLIDSYKYDFYCSTHPEELLNAYCKTCSINMCQKCISEKLHKGHRFVKYAKISLTKKDEDKLVENIKSYADKIEGNVKRTNELYNLHTDEEVKEELKDVCTATVVDNKSILALVKYFQNIYHAINPKNYAIIYNVIENIKFNPQPMPPDCDASLEEKTLDFVEYLKRDFVLFKRFNAPTAKHTPSVVSFRNKTIDSKKSITSNTNKNTNNTANNNKKEETNQNLNKKEEGNASSNNVNVNENLKCDKEEQQKQKETNNPEKTNENTKEEEHLYQIKNLLKMEDKIENNEKIKAEEEKNNENNQIHDNEKIEVTNNIAPEITLLNNNEKKEENAKKEEKEEDEIKLKEEKKEEKEVKPEETEKKEESEKKEENGKKSEEVEKKEENEKKPEETEKKEESEKKEEKNEQNPEIKKEEENKDKEKSEATENPTAAPGHILGLPLELAEEMDNLKKEQELKKEREAKRKMKTQKALERLRKKNQKERIANSTSNNSILNNPKFIMIAKMMSSRAVGQVKEEEKKNELQSPNNSNQDKSSNAQEVAEGENNEEKKE